jgi:hypothetical protein
LKSKENELKKLENKKFVFNKQKQQQQINELKVKIEELKNEKNNIKENHTSSIYLALQKIEEFKRAHPMGASQTFPERQQYAKLYYDFVEANFEAICNNRQITDPVEKFAIFSDCKTACKNAISKDAYATLIPACDLKLDGTPIYETSDIAIEAEYETQHKLFGSVNNYEKAAAEFSLNKIQDEMKNLDLSLPSNVTKLEELEESMKLALKDLNAVNFRLVQGIKDIPDQVTIDDNGKAILTAPNHFNYEEAKAKNQQIKILKEQEASNVDHIEDMREEMKPNRPAEDLEKILQPAPTKKINQTQQKFIPLMNVEESENVDAFHANELFKPATTIINKDIGLKRGDFIDMNSIDIE